MLIRNAEVDSGTTTDLRLTDAIVTGIGPQLEALAGEEVLEADGGLLLPGLQDHHLHLLALAGALDSAACGPPQVRTAEELAQSLLQHAAANAGDSEGWIRGIGYHQSVAGDIDRDWLDRLLPNIDVEGAQLVRPHLRQVEVVPGKHKDEEALVKV